MTPPMETKMNSTSGLVLRVGLLSVLAAGLSACQSGEFFEDVQRYHGPDSVIAKASDSGTDDVGLIDGEAAIAYDPDGCQVWIIDDGVEGYSTPRFDPARRSEDRPADLRQQIPARNCAWPL